MPKEVSLAKPIPKPPNPNQEKHAKKAQTLFEMMRVLSAAQRQEFGALRREWKAKPDIVEKIEQDGKEWVVRYYKGGQKVAEASFSPLNYHIKEF